MGYRRGAVQLFHQRAMPLHVRGVNLFDFAEHPTIVDLVQPAQTLLFRIGVCNGYIALHLRRILSQHAAIFADVHHAEAFIELLFCHIKCDLIGIQAKLFH